MLSWSRRVTDGSASGHGNRSVKLVRLVRFLPVVAAAFGCGARTGLGTSAVGGPLRVESIASGNDHSCVVLSDHTVRCWGFNSQLQLGVPDFDDATSARRPTGFVDPVSRVSAGSSHTCALTTKGAVWCWGAAGQGQLGSNVLPPFQPPHLVFTTGAIDVCAGGHHSCAVMADGTAECWGDNSHGNLGDGSDLGRRLPAPVHDLNHARRIACGDAVTCALLDDATVRCWGGAGQVGNGTQVDTPTPVEVAGLGGVATIDCGSGHTCVTLFSGAVACWGSNTRGQIGGTEESVLVPRTIDIGSDSVTAVSAGSIDTCILTTNGDVRCWGGNVWGQIGDGTTVDRSAPFSVGLRASAISAGGVMTCAVRTDGTTTCWGSNVGAELGDGTKTSRFFPGLPVLGLEE